MASWLVEDAKSRVGETKIVNRDRDSLDQQGSWAAPESRRDASKTAPAAPSTSRWSQLNPKVILSPACKLPLESRTGLFRLAPTDKIAALGGVDDATEEIDAKRYKLVTVKRRAGHFVGCQLLLLAFPIRDFASNERLVKSRDSAFLTTRVAKPSSTATPNAKWSVS